MRKRFLVLTTSLGLAALPVWGATLVNGNFEGSPFTTGWTTTGTTTAATGANAISGTTSSTVVSGALYQTFEPTGLASFQLDFAFQLASETTAGRVRLRSGILGDSLVFRFSANNAGANTDFIEAYNGSSWVSVLSGISLAANTSYSMRVIGENFGIGGQSYTVAFSNDGVNYVTSAPKTVFQTGGQNFGTIVFEGNGGNLTVDNVSIVPESSAALLGLVGSLGLMRRRRC